MVIAQALGYAYKTAIPAPKHLTGTKAHKKRVHAYLKRQNRKRAHGRRRYNQEAALIAQELTGTDHYATVRAARQIPAGVAKKILGQGLPGLTSIPEGVRSYPQVSVASQLLGYTVDGNGSTGGGLEYLLNPILASRPGEEATVNGPDSALETITVKPPHNGRNVTLTLDSNVQAHVQQVVDRTVRQYGAHSGSAIVMDPRTGAILAMVNSPSYNNNQVHDLDPKAFARMTPNGVVQNVYEPGSVMKVVTSRRR